MKKLLLPLLTLGAVSLLFTGCAHREGAYMPVNTTKFNQESSANFVLLDPRAQYSVTCAGIQLSPLPEGGMEVTANVRNRENRSIEVQIDCVFKDEQYFPVDEVPFKTIVLTENAMQGVSFKSTNIKAKTYTIRVRQVR
jgi:hypothetical protein